MRNRNPYFQLMSDASAASFSVEGVMAALTRLSKVDLFDAQRVACDDDVYMISASFSQPDTPPVSGNLQLLNKAVDAAAHLFNLALQTRSLLSIGPAMPETLHLWMCLKIPCTVLMRVDSFFDKPGSTQAQAAARHMMQSGWCLQTLPCVQAALVTVAVWCIMMYRKSLPACDFATIMHQVQFTYCY